MLRDRYIAIFTGLVIVVSLLSFLFVCYFLHYQFVLKYPLGTAIQEVLNEDVLVLSIIEGPRKKEDFYVSGYKAPSRDLDAQNKLLIIADKDHIIYLHFNKEGVLVYKDVCGS